MRTCLGIITIFLSDVFETTQSLQINTGINFIDTLFSNGIITTSEDTKPANVLMRELVNEENCYSSVAGAQKFVDLCAEDVIYEDCFEPQPIVGKEDLLNYMIRKAQGRKDKGKVRLDRISDGDQACGFAWTWCTENEEGLRGTTYVELNKVREIAFVREIPEPLFKPGDLTAKLLEAVTKGAEPKIVEYEKKTPTKANEIAKYLFNEVQGASVDEGMRFFGDDIIYRDFNFENPLFGKDEVRKFIEDFNFPGITFKIQRIDDGVLSTSFCWEVVLEGIKETTRGISLYELNPETKLISYVRDVPEGTMKPPPLGNLARQLRPGLGYFSGVKVGSRKGGR